jgi:hypothetical protein
MIIWYWSFLEKKFTCCVYSYLMYELNLIKQIPDFYSYNNFFYNKNSISAIPSSRKNNWLGGWKDMIYIDRFTDFEKESGIWSKLQTYLKRIQKYWTFKDFSKIFKSKSYKKTFVRSLITLSNRYESPNLASLLNINQRLGMGVYIDVNSYFLGNSHFWFSNALVYSLFCGWCPVSLHDKWSHSFIFSWKSLNKKNN